MLVFLSSTSFHTKDTSSTDVATLSPLSQLLHQLWLPDNIVLFSTFWTLETGCLSVSDDEHVMTLFAVSRERRGRQSVHLLIFFLVHVQYFSPEPMQNPFLVAEATTFMPYFSKLIVASKAVWVFYP